MNTLKAKIANARKRRILVIAWTIRKEAAKKFNCNPTKILMKECIEKAWKVEKHAEQQPIQIRSKQEIIDLFMNGKIQEPTQQEAQVFVDALLNGETKAIPKNKRIRQEDFLTVNIKMGIPKKPNKAPQTEQEIAKKIINFAGVNDPRVFLNYVMKFDKYFIASNGHQAAFIPKNEQTNILEFVDANNQQVINEELENKKDKTITDVFMNGLNGETHKHAENINAYHLTAYLENVMKLERVINCKYNPIVIPILIENLIVYVNCKYLLNAVSNLANTQKRLKISLRISENEHDGKYCSLIKLENKTGETHIIMPCHIRTQEENGGCKIAPINFDDRTNQLTQMLYF
jgi:hypothetical protein